MYRRLRNIPARIPFRVFAQNLRLRGLWGNVREALAGSDQDFTSLKLNKAICLTRVEPTLRP